MFLIAIGTVAGIHKTPAIPVFLCLATIVGASRSQRLRKVEFLQAPAALCMSLALAMATALLGVLLADLYASTMGVGFYTRLFTHTLQGPKLFGLILLLAAMSITIKTGRMKQGKETIQ